MPNGADELLQRLVELDWFHSVGRPVIGDEVISAASWDEAIRFCSTEAWEVASLEAANSLSGRLHELHPDWSAKKWNLAADSICMPVRELVEKRMPEFARTHGLPKLVSDSVDWTLIHYLKEATFSPAPGFFTRLGEFFLLGHFPCGWKGNYPKGKLIVY